MSTPISGSGSSSTTPTTESQNLLQLLQSQSNPSSNASTQPTISFGGLVSGINTQQIIQALLAQDEAPILQLQTEQASEQAKLTEWQNLNTKLQSLQTAAQSLGLQSTVSARNVTFAGPSGTFATGTATSSATDGTFQLAIDNLATATTATSSKGIGASITDSDILSTSSKLSTPVTAGTFTVDGHTVTITTGEDLGSVLSDISTQTGGTVTASIVNNRIQLTSSSAITLGSGGDTSNFLSVVKLLGQPSATTMTSSGPVGVANPNVSLDTANINGLTSDTTGSFVINGVTITYNSTTDSLNTILGKINASAAGVTAAYDPNSDTVTFTSSKTGNIDFSMADGSGNLLQSLNTVTQAASSTNIGNAIVGTDDATSTSKLPTDVTTGTFTVHGVQVTITAGETFSSILADISTQTGGAVTGAIVGDTIQLTSHDSTAVGLGNGGDTSNFLTVTKLSGQGSGLTATSTGPVGQANDAVALDNANLNGLQSTTTGSLVINGVAISYNTTTDTLNDVLQRINTSGAGVSASYDTTSDTVTLTSTTGGSITVSDASGNLGSTLGLPSSTASSHTIGQSAKYEINGVTQYSLSNTVNNIVPGVNVTFQAVTPSGSPLTADVNLDSSVGSKAIQDFVTAYNAVIDEISKDTAFDTNTNTGGIFLGDPTINAIESQLDEGLFISNGSQLGLTPPYTDISTIGLSTGPIGSQPGTTTDLQFDATSFQNALTANPTAVTNLVNTVFNQLSTTVNNIIQPFGLVDSAIQGETQQIIDYQHDIDDQQLILQQQQQFLTDEFTNLDTELAQIQSQSAAGSAVLASLGSSTTSTPSTSSTGTTGTTGA